jgi:hypothetical protein
MNDEINGLLRKVGKLMQDQLAAQNFDAATKLSPLLSRLQDLQKRAEVIAGELSEIQSALNQVNGRQSPQRVAELLPQWTRDEEPEEASRALPHTLRLKIDWHANRIQHETEEICEHTAAAGMAIFIGRLIHEFGDQALKKLEAVRINRGPLISRTPAKDFINATQGKLYGHKKIPGTDYFLLTHSSTAQKLEDIRRICRVLGLVPGSVQGEQIDRQSIYL